MPLWNTVGVLFLLIFMALGFLPPFILTSQKDILWDKKKCEN